MAFQQGASNIANAASATSVVYPAAFLSTPDVVIAVVQNTVDGGPLSISAEVTASSNTGFTVQLSAATDSANYDLVWVAGDAQIIFEILSQLGFRVSELGLQTSLPLDDDYFPMVHTSPLPATKRIKWSVIKTAFTQFVSSAPSASSDSGTVGQWAVDADFIYTHDGTAWGRTPRATTGWGFTHVPTWSAQGQQALTQDVDDVSVVFDEAFGAAPEVIFSFQNTAGGNLQILQGLITAVSTTGFTVSLNTTPDTTAYKMNWRASSIVAP
jgi:hypothetical protein